MFLTSIILLGIFNNVVNIHTHVLADGQIVVHSHPFNKDIPQNAPAQRHKHLNSEYTFLNFTNLSVLLLLLVLGFIIKNHYFSIKLSFAETETFVKFFFFNKNTLRGPPQFL